MTIGAKLFWGLVAFTALVYGALGYTSGIVLRGMSGGLPSFDFRSSGYSHEEAQDFLYALSTGGTEYYLNVVQKIDTVFPALLTAVLTIGIYHLMRGGSALLRLVLLAAPLAYAGFDYWENGLVRQMLQFIGEELPRELSSLASIATVSKFAALGAAVLILLALMVLRWRQHR